jgi:hypothetical protein
MLNVEEMNLSYEDILFIFRQTVGENIKVVKTRITLTGYTEKRGKFYTFVNINEIKFIREIKEFYIHSFYYYEGMITEIHFLDNPQIEEKIKRIFKLKNLYKK